MTLSVLARDPRSGELGAATASHSPAAGARVAWVEAGLGAALTQGITEVRHGPALLEGLRAGPPAAALARALEADPDAPWRQLAVMDRHGAVALHEGERSLGACAAWGGRGLAVLGNMLARDGVAAAVRAAFAQHGGSLPARLVAALAAGDRHGGDRRGARSAALVVAASAPGGPATVSLRVDDAGEPLAELEALLGVWRCQELVAGLYRRAVAGTPGAPWGEIDDLLAAAAGDERLAAHLPDLWFWGGLVHRVEGDELSAERWLRRAFAAGERWRDLHREALRQGLGSGGRTRP